MARAPGGQGKQAVEHHRARSRRAAAERWSGLFLADLAALGPDALQASTSLAMVVAELLGVDLATLRKLTASVEPYVRADGTRI